MDETPTPPDLATLDGIDAFVRGPFAEYLGELARTKGSVPVTGAVLALHGPKGEKLKRPRASILGNLDAPEAKVLAGMRQAARKTGAAGAVSTVPNPARPREVLVVLEHATLGDVAWSGKLRELSVELGERRDARPEEQTRVLARRWAN